MEGLGLFVERWVIYSRAIVLNDAIGAKKRQEVLDNRWSRRSEGASDCIPQRCELHGTLRASFLEILDDLRKQLPCSRKIKWLFRRWDPSLPIALGTRKRRALAQHGTEFLLYGQVAQRHVEGPATRDAILIGLLATVGECAEVLDTGLAVRDGFIAEEAFVSLLDEQAL